MLIMINIVCRKAKMIVGLICVTSDDIVFELKHNQSCGE